MDKVEQIELGNTKLFFGEVRRFSLDVLKNLKSFI